MEEYSKVKVDKFGIKKEASKTINEFSRTLSQNKIDLNGFYRNINSSRIVYMTNTEGYYDPLEKNLMVDPNRIRESLLRALFEMSASCVFQDIYGRTVVASGFERTLNDKEHWPEQIYHIGYGLSQGYKDILLARYFGIEGRYSRLSELVVLFEYIVGNKAMMEAFMTGDLALIKSSFGDSEAYKSIRTLLKMDNMYDALYLDNSFRKIGINFTYRDLVIELSKQALNKALDYYNQLRIFYEARDKSGMESKGSIVEEILAYINSILQNRKKQPLLLGLKPCDIEEIVRYSEKKFECLPQKYHLKG